MRCVLAFLLLLPWLMACEKLHNRLDPQVLDCGDEARGSSGPWIKVLDPQGQQLADDELLDARALVLDANGALPPALQLSKKHCVNAGQNTSLVIRSLADDRSWSVVVHRTDGSWNQQVQLQDNSLQRVHLRCPDPWIHNGRFLLPLEISPGTRLEAFALAPILTSPDGRLWGQNYALQSASIPLIWPHDWPDGVGRLTLLQRNFLQNSRSSLAEITESCAVIVDRQKPLLRLTPTPSTNGVLDVQPGSLLRVQIIDAHPANLRWCLQPIEASTCSNEDAWQTAEGEVSLPMPAQGRWLLQARASDAAGNAAEPLQQVIDVLQNDLIHTIGARVDQALAEKTDNSWQAALSLMQALVDYQRLVLPKEQDQVKNKLIDGILSAAPAIQERQRVQLSGAARRVWSVNSTPESPWLVLTSTELSLWSAQGRLLSKINVPDVLAADWSMARQTLALATLDQLLVIGLQGSTLLEPLSLRWEDQSIFGTPADVKWIPGTSNLVVAIHGDLPAVLEQSSSGIGIAQRLDLKDTRRLAVASDGTLLAATNFDELSIWRAGAGGWVNVDADELPVKDLQFTRATDKVPGRLLILLRDGRLTSWSPGILWKEIDQGLPGELPTDRPDGREAVHLQPWADGRTGLVERGGRFYQWSSDLNKTLQTIKLSGFAWDRLRFWKVDPCQKAVWMLDDRSLSYWQWQDETEPSFVKRGEWKMTPDQLIDFQSHCHPDDRDFITLDASAGRLRFWSQRGPLPMVRGDSNTTVISSFSPGRAAGEVLITAGFDGNIRLWNRAGKKLQEWVGHTAQVNEVRFFPEWQHFLSSAEDGSSRVWNIDGHLMNILSLASVPNALWRDGIIPMDEKHLLSAGTGVLALWTRIDKSIELTITISLDSGERSGFDSLKRLSGAPRVLARLLKSGSWRGLIIHPDGTVKTSEPGLPPLQKLKWLQWSPDGQRLALADAEQTAHIYRQTPEGWQEEPLGLKGLVRFTFAPDGQSFAAVRAGKKLLVGTLANGQWQIAKEETLRSGLEMESGLRWSADAQRIVYAQSGQIFVHDRMLQVQHQFQAFPENGRLSSFGLSQDSNVLAAGSGPWVRLIDFDLQRLKAQMCTWLDAYLATADAANEVVSLCAKELRRKETRSLTERIPWR